MYCFLIVLRGMPLPDMGKVCEDCMMLVEKNVLRINLLRLLDMAMELPKNQILLCLICFEYFPQSAL